MIPSRSVRLEKLQEFLLIYHMFTWIIATAFRLKNETILQEKIRLIRISLLLLQVTENIYTKEGN